MGGEKVAFVRNADGFERRDVKTGKSDDESVEVVSGLEPGEEIAVKNTFLLKAELGKGEAEHHD
jgi:membrane fusion protein, heavy metal efflux system